MEHVQKHWREFANALATQQQKHVHCERLEEQLTNQQQAFWSM
jgi:hypothetical protein